MLLCGRPDRLRQIRGATGQGHDGGCPGDATANTSGWTFNFPNRKPVPVRVVAVDGDSIVTEAGPFESVLRKGVQVTSRTVNRLQDGKLVGATVARYATSRPGSVLRLRFEGTHAP